MSYAVIRSLQYTQYLTSWTVFSEMFLAAFFVSIFYATIDNLRSIM